MPLTSDSLFQEPARDAYRFASRRSVVHSTEGIVSCSQPLAAKCGLDILRAGGNAAVSHDTIFLNHFLCLFTNKIQDAAVAVGT